MIYSSIRGFIGGKTVSAIYYFNRPLRKATGALFHRIATNRANSLERCEIRFALTALIDIPRNYCGELLPHDIVTNRRNFRTETHRAISKCISPCAPRGRKHRRPVEISEGGHFTTGVTRPIGRRPCASAFGVHCQCASNIVREWQTGWRR